MVHNVNVNVDLYIWLSCELVMWLNISKSQYLVIIYRASGRWRVNWKLERCTSQRWGAQVQTNRNYVLPRWFVVVVFGATDRHSTCAYQKLMESSKQPNSVLGGCHHASLMQILVSISRISIPSDYAPRTTLRYAMIHYPHRCPHHDHYKPSVFTTKTQQQQKR